MSDKAMPDWERNLRRWPRERIKPATVARCIDLMLTDLAAVRAAQAAAEQQAEALRDRMRDALDCLPRALDGSQPFSMGQRAEVMLAIESLRKALAAASGAAQADEQGGA